MPALNEPVFVVAYAGGRGVPGAPALHYRARGATRPPNWQAPSYSQSGSMARNRAIRCGARNRLLNRAPRNGETCLMQRSS
jgi:hypothetical protein